MSYSPEKASEASEDKAEAAEPEKVQGGDEEEEDEEDVVAWGWGQATSWMSSTVSSVSQVRLLLSFKCALVMSWYGII